MTTFRPPTHRDIGKMVEVYTSSDGWLSGTLTNIRYDEGESAHYCVDAPGRSLIWHSPARTPIDTTAPAEKLSIAADLLADHGMELAEQVLRNWPQVVEALNRIVVDEGIDAGVILVDGESRTQWNNELQRSEYLNNYFSELGEALVMLSRMVKGTANVSR